MSGLDLTMRNDWIGIRRCHCSGFSRGKFIWFYHMRLIAIVGGLYVCFKPVDVNMLGFFYRYFCVLNIMVAF